MLRSQGRHVYKRRGKNWETGQHPTSPQPTNQLRCHYRATVWSQQKSPYRRSGARWRRCWTRRRSTPWWPQWRASPPPARRARWRRRQLPPPPRSCRPWTCWACVRTARHCTTPLAAATVCRPTTVGRARRRTQHSPCAAGCCRRLPARSASTWAAASTSSSVGPVPLCNDATAQERIA